MNKFSIIKEQKITLIVALLRVRKAVKERKKQVSLLIVILSALIIIATFIGRQFRNNNQEENLLITQPNQNKDSGINKEEYKS